MKTQNNQSERGVEALEENEKESILNRCAYKHTDEKGDLEVIVGGKILQVIILMLLCSLKSEYMECVTSGRKMPINDLKLEVWLSLPPAMTESDVPCWY